MSPSILLKHLPGRHNQKSHTPYGKRSSKFPSDYMTFHKYESAQMIDKIERHYDNIWQLCYDSNGIGRSPIPLKCSSIRYYTSSGYYDINDALRSNKSGSKNIKGYIQDIDAVMNESPGAPTNMLVYRGVSTRYKDFQPGDIFQDNGYPSTSISEYNADSWKSGGTLEIRVPKGHKGIYIDTISNAPQEQEFLLPRGTKFRVVSNNRNQITNKFRMVLEIVP
jgi:ADP-ribosyltransferase exoenzyme